jgi:hypothetical protein
MAASRGWLTATAGSMTSSASNSARLLAVFVLATLLDGLRRYEPAATIAGFAASPLSAAAYPGIITACAHLRDALGAERYDSLARKGESMTIAEIAAYAYDQIDQARAELNTVSE